MLTLTPILIAIGLLAPSGLQARTEEAMKIHPTVYMTPADVQRAKENVARFRWAKETAEEIIREADAWLVKEDSWLLGVLPPAGACFAYGFTGCPICGAGWGTWGGARASFDNPGHVTCGNSHVLPDADHPDSGTGYTGKDGRIHYFVGSYNAWVVETLTFRAVDNLAYAYTLTGDDRYAAKAVLILDALAAIYPTCDKGSWDYPSSPPSGRFDRPWYQVARVLVHYVDQYDQLYQSKSLDAASLSPGLTRRQNIEENLLKNGASYCYRQSLDGALHNGEADYIRGALAVGACLGIPEYVRWAVDGPYGIYSMLDNNIDRNGFYYETSASYADHTRDLYLTFAEPLLNYRGSAYPQGIDLYQYPRLNRFLRLHNLAQNCLGHRWPPYGDTSPIVGKAARAVRPFDLADFRFLERLYTRTEGKKERRDLAALLMWLAGGRAGAAAGGGLDEMGRSFDDLRWRLFHFREVPDIEEPIPSGIARRLTGSDFLGQKGIGILRAGTGEGAQALLLRYGPSLNHGHLDDLNFNYFARGYEMTYDLGYILGSTHTQVGWAHQTASHNLAVVNEASQGRESGSTGGSLHLFADLPSVRLIEASSEPSYAAEGITLYRRTMALIGDTSTGQPVYLLDLFRVSGGRQHDYLFHALGEKVDFEGIAFGPEEPGSLAGPGIAWGDQQLNDGDIEGYPNKPYWNPPPGNGYGFLVRPRRGKTDAMWSADWLISEKDRLRLIVPAFPGAELITASAPGLYPTLPRARYVLVRRKGENLKSRFTAVIEPCGEKAQVQSVENLPLRPSGGSVPAMAVKVIRSDGTEDFIFSTDDTKIRRTGDIAFAGRFAHICVKEGQILALSTVGARQFSGFGWSVRPKKDGWKGTAERLDYANNTITTRAPLPADGSLNGQVIIFSDPLYSRTTAYRIARIEAAGGRRRIYLDGPMAMGKGQVEAVKGRNTLTSPIPHEYARSVHRRGDSGFFTGKLIRTDPGASAHIKAIRYGQPMTLTVDNTEGFKPGEVFHYYDIQPGDRFDILATLSLTQTAPGRYRLQSEAEAEIIPPGGKAILIEGRK